MRGDTIFTAKEFDTVIWADLGALITADTLTDKVIFRESPWWANISLSELLYLKGRAGNREF